MNKVEIVGIVKTEPKIYGRDKGSPMANLFVEFKDGSRVGSVTVKVFHQECMKISLNDRLRLLGTVRTSKIKAGKYEGQWATEVCCNFFEILPKNETTDKFPMFNEDVPF
jgi:hypothetical protein